MASLLAARFREHVSSMKDYTKSKEKEADVSYSTGFPNLDFRNGLIVHVKNEEKNLDYNYYSVGITDGSLNTFVGRSGCGKSTLVTQICANIIRPFPTSCVFEDLIESGMSDARKEKLTGFIGDELKERFVTRNTGINSENFYERIKAIHDMRIENSSDFYYNTGYKDFNGNPITKMEPCCYILDSWALLRPKGLTEEEQISGQMSVTSSAKLNTEIIRRVVPLLKEANINLFVINHILDDVQINPFAKKRGQLQYLSQGERMVGGNTLIYLSNNMFQLIDTKLKPEMFGINGSIITVKILKSRTNKAGQETQLVYDQDRGYDSDLSLYITLKEAGKIQTSGAWAYIEGYKDMKFQQKGFKDKLQNDPDFKAVFIDTVLEVLKDMCYKDNQPEFKSIVSVTSNDLMNRLMAA